jgi:AcrR family transcriptional regulator
MRLTAAGEADRNPEGVDAAGNPPLPDEGANGASATRALLLSAAAEAFDEAGYLGASLNEIAAAAAVTKGALYFHFPHKRALAEAVIAAMNTGWTAMVAEVTARTEDPLTALLDMFDSVALALIADPIARGATRLLHDPIMRTQHTAELATHQYDYAQATTLTQLDAATGAGLLVSCLDAPRRDQLARSLVATITGHHLVCDLTGTLPQLWDRITTMWLELLPMIASEEWLHTWSRSGWPHRAHPTPT